MREQPSLPVMPIPNSREFVFLVLKIFTSVLVIFPEMAGVRPRLTSFSQYLDSSKTPLIPHSGQKCRLHEILIAENGTFCNFYHLYESFMRNLNNFKSVKLS